MPGLSPVAVGALSAAGAATATTAINAASGGDIGELAVAVPITAATVGVVSLGLKSHPEYLVRGGRGFQVMAGAILGTVAAHGVFQLGRAAD